MREIKLAIYLAICLEHHDYIFYIIRLITKQFITTIWSFYIILTGVEANKVILTLF